MSSWNFQDLTGQRFGNLTVIAEGPKTNSGRTTWVCRCDCGKEKIVRAHNLKRGTTISCGCHKYALAKERLTKHGDSQKRLYRIWWNMIHRCEYKKSNRYKNYGGRGISVCEEWRNSYEEFRDWALSNGYSDDLSIDRIDVDGNYCPKNCRWVTEEVQANNTSKNHLIYWQGKRQSLAQWEKEIGFRSGTLSQRISRGWSIEKALSTPILHRTA